MPERREARKDPMVILWIAANRSALTEVAKECGVTVQFVSYCLYGNRRSRDGKVERLLREMGAPVKGA